MKRVHFQNHQKNVECTSIDGSTNGSITESPKDKKRKTCFQWRRASSCFLPNSENRGNKEIHFFVQGTLNNCEKCQRYKFSSLSWRNQDILTRWRKTNIVVNFLRESKAAQNEKKATNQVLESRTRRRIVVKSCRRNSISSTYRT